MAPQLRKRKARAACLLLGAFWLIVMWWLRQKLLLFFCGSDFLSDVMVLLPLIGDWCMGRWIEDLTFH